MNILGLSAGTGPAAAILGGVVLYILGEQALGLILVVAGIGLSLFWAARFK